MLINKTLSLGVGVEKGSRFANDNPLIIKEIFKVLSYNDEPKVYSYSICCKEKYNSGENEDAITSASGISFDKRKALMRVLGETIERYSLGGNKNEKFAYNSFDELKKLNKLALNPEALIAFSDRKHIVVNLNEKNLHWVKGKSLVSNNEILVPAQLVYVPYLHQNSEPLIRFPISTGAAAGETFKDASYRGICEIIERDAFMIAYLNKIPSPKIDLSSINDKKIRHIRNVLKRYKLEPIILDLTNDLRIPVFASIILDKTGLGPAVSVGLKAGFDIKETIIGAIEESLMMRSWIRDKFIYTDLKYRRGKEIITIEDRAHFWFPVSSIRYLDFWLKNKNFKKIRVENLRYSDNKLEKAIELLKERNMEAIYVDITDKDIEKYDFKVVKVIVSKLCPLYLDERYPYLGIERLYNVPVEMKIFKKQKTESQLNEIPHPFL